MVGKYKKFKKNGLWKTYYRSGNLKEKTDYKNGKLVGIFKTYHENQTDCKS